jgi:hypothetical protein
MRNKLNILSRMGNAISSPKQCAASILQCGHLKQLAIDPAIEYNRTTIIPPRQRQPPRDALESPASRWMPIFSMP